MELAAEPGLEMGEINYISLERQEGGAKHFVGSTDVRVSKDGIVYAKNPTLTHENGDHPNVTSKDWVAYYRNTAVRAFSVEGVD